VRIRPLEFADAPACDAIIASLPYHFGNEEGRAQCAEAVRTARGLVAVEADTVLGFLTWVPRFDAAAEVTWMAVHGAHRRRGIGRMLLDELIEVIRRDDRSLVIVLTVSPNGDEDSPADGYPATRAFYSAMGFVLARDLPREWRSDTAVMMVRPL
jgi:ribosomal protein S18 acetylase RimI-like enzyme